MISILLKILFFIILISSSLSAYITPEHIEQHIKRLIAQNYQLYVINLGNTVNNNPLKAYIITGIKKQSDKLNELSQYPATLITSYMHPRQPYSIKLMQKILDQVLNNYQTDYFLKYLLDNTLLILFPFVNIDGYYRYKELEEQNKPKQIIQSYRKNMNKYINCQHQWEQGVDINRNFDTAFGSIRTSDNECGQQYRGPNAFSQKQSKAIKILFKKFHITLAIDIHSYGNKWIYPYASLKSNSKLQNNQLYPLYQDLKIKLKSINKTMQSCYQSLGYTADGVYIDWALDQGALSMAVQIGMNFNSDNRINQEILFQVQESFHIVLRKNSISYKKYLTSNGIFILQSTSLIDFYVQIQDKINQIKSNKYLKSGKSLLFPQLINSQKITLIIKDTQVIQEIQLSQLQIININTKIQNKLFIKYLKFLFIIIIALGLIIFCIKSYRKKQIEKITKNKFNLKQANLSIQQIDEENLNTSMEERKLYNSQ